ncbi:DUF309 domain-containing protein [Fictibacillus aquaticus]|uniref:DUF309 domain-containing protein n=1 Tax=Fictibacillus aquaticus TaxID=2021314 RepID=A0A235F527_9BACL|nr:DUF309 domain-containing protein [Fictibacillus aquaticus]OYD56360.1 hypothetical protein CGZ90_17840 [Fictibacillus aquaticus]
MESYPEEYYEFFISFNEGDYYTCHDLLEEMWLTDKSNLFLKGLLQMSVALYHYSYGNIKGARLMFEAGYEYLKDYAPVFWDLNVSEVLEYIKRCQSILPKRMDTVPFEQVKSLPPLPVLYLYLE